MKTIFKQLLLLICRLLVYGVLLIQVELTTRLEIISFETWFILLIALLLLYVSITEIDIKCLKKIWSSRRAVIYSVWIFAGYWMYMFVEWQSRLNGVTDHESFMPYEIRMILAGFPSSLVGLAISFLQREINPDMLEGVAIRHQIVYAWGSYAVPFFLQLLIVWEIWKKQHDVK